MDRLERLRALAHDARVVRLHRALGPRAELHLVGGALRSALLGESVKDIDLAGRLEAAEVARELERSGVRVILTGVRHQTVTAVPVAEAGGVEITTFRRRAPDGSMTVSPSIEEDLRLRDFTINALAFSLDSEELLDPCGGAADLERRCIRAVGRAEERFSEDPLRVLRMIRFACALQFEIVDETLLAAAGFGESLSGVAVERVREELSKTLLSPEPDRGLALLRDLGLLGRVLPELVPTVGFEQNRFHRAELFTHTLEVVRRAPPDLVVRLAALFHDVGKPATLIIDEATGDRHFFRHEVVGAEITAAALERLRYPHDVIRAVTELVRLHMRPLEAGASGLRRLLRDTGEHFSAWRELKIADCAACKLSDEEVREQVERFDEAIMRVRMEPTVSPLAALAVHGDDLLALGIPEGPEIGRILRALHEYVLDDPSRNDREWLLSEVPALRDRLRTATG